MSRPSTTSSRNGCKGEMHFKPDPEQTSVFGGSGVVMGTGYCIAADQVPNSDMAIPVPEGLRPKEYGQVQQYQKQGFDRLTQNYPVVDSAGNQTAWYHYSDSRHFLSGLPGLVVLGPVLTFFAAEPEPARLIWPTLARLTCCFVSVIRSSRFITCATTMLRWDSISRSVLLVVLGLSFW